MSNVSTVKGAGGLYPEYKIGDEDSDLLFITQNFEVGLHRNQVLPGILQIRPLENIQLSWDEWKDQHWVEFLKVVRLSELVLIDTFEPRAYDINPYQDRKLVNCIGKQRDTDGEDPGITFDIVPRYKFPVTITLPGSCKSVNFTDERYAKPFSFKEHSQTDEEVRNRIGVLLRNKLAYKIHEKFILEGCYKTLQECINCKPLAENPYGLLESCNFRMAMHREDQAKGGRCIVGSKIHYPALRYWTDPQLIIEFGNMFKCIREACKTLYTSDGEVGGFDVMWLMNYFESDGGVPHTHAHIIPRYKSDPSYGQDYSFDKFLYVPIPSNKLSKFKEEYAEAIKDQMNKRSEAA